MISAGDFIELFHLLNQKGLKFILKNFMPTAKDRTLAKWNMFEKSHSDFWVIPQIQNWWSLLCTGNPNTNYETYVAKKYLSGKTGLRMLSVGCGNSSHEMAFYNSGCFDLVVGVDISEKQLALARNKIENREFNIQFLCLDFEKESLAGEKFDLVLFDSSLHHFKDVKFILREKTLPLLKENGLVVAFEYTGPNRLQWTEKQLQLANNLIKDLPASKKTFPLSTRVKKKVHRPGILRMFLSDPSEAPDSESILQALHQNLDTLEETKLGGNIVHPLLKNIAHHFIDGSIESEKLISQLLNADAEFARNNASDFTFGVYKKRAG